MHMTPLQRYQADIRKPGFHFDPQQQYAVQHTQQLYDALVAAPARKKTLWQRLRGKPLIPIRGLYLCGGTGRGKTYLVDAFYECLPLEKKHRVHFHRFMLDIHAELKTLPRSPDPLQVIAERIAQKYRVLCLDEFHVHDIADAMLLAGFLQALFDRGVTLVATSNIPIEDLYKNGLQRERFMYAISLLQQHTREVDLGSGTDYRFEILGENNNYRILDSEAGNRFLLDKLTTLVPCEPKHQRSIEINNRQIDYVAWADDVIWFEFEAICNTPRSAHDYIELAERFHTVLLGNIPQMQARDDSAVKRFIHLIDALYDHNVKLLATAAAEPKNLYAGERMRFTFERTISRLTEMGSQRYLQLAHNPTGTTRTRDSATDNIAI